MPWQYQCQRVWQVEDGGKVTKNARKSKNDNNHLFKLTTQSWGKPCQKCSVSLLNDHNNQNNHNNNNNNQNNNNQNNNNHNNMLTKLINDRHLSADDMQQVVAHVVSQVPHEGCLHVGERDLLQKLKI